MKDSKHCYNLVISILFILSISISTTVLSQKKPNILLIITDDQGWGDVSFHNNANIDTPVLDNLAKQSVQFDRFYVSPVCAPTRASVLTGKYHFNTGVSWVTHRKEVMRSEEHTLAELVAEKGYRTGLFGKWHNGKQYPNDPIGQGFQTFFGFTDGHLNNYYDTNIQSQFEIIPTKGYFPDVMTQKAIDFIQKNNDPFFCYVSYNTPHSPFQLSDSLFSKYRTKGFGAKTASVYGMVENLDYNIGRLLHQLEVQNILDNTIIIFMTDNGPNGVRYNGGFKGKKAEVDEGGVRVPFLLRYDNANWKVKTISEMAAHIDIYPTLASLLGIDISKRSSIDGVNLMPLLNKEQKTLPHRKFFTHQVRTKVDTIPGAVRTNKYLLTLKAKGTALYDLSKDSYQKNDISSRYPKIKDSLQAAYNQWFAKTNIANQPLIPISLGYDQVPYVIFPAPDASSFVKTEFKGGDGWAHDYFVNFKNVSRIDWGIYVTKPITYDVYVEIAKDTNPVTFKLKTNQSEINTTIKEEHKAKKIHSPDRIPRKEVYEWRWPKVKIGTVHLERSDSKIVLSIENGDKAKLMLKSLELRQIGSGNKRK